MVNVSLTKAELVAIIRLVSANSTSIRLQTISFLGVQESIALNMKLSKYNDWEYIDAK